MDTTNTLEEIKSRMTARAFGSGPSPRMRGERLIAQRRQAKWEKHPRVRRELVAAHLAQCR